MIDSHIFIGAELRRDRESDCVSIYLTEIYETSTGFRPFDSQPQRHARWQTIKRQVSLDYLAGYIDAACDQKVMRGAVYLYNGYSPAASGFTIRSPPHAPDEVAHLDPRELVGLDVDMWAYMLARTNIDKDPMGTVKESCLPPRWSLERYPDILLYLPCTALVDAERRLLEQHGVKRKYRSWLTTPPAYDYDWQLD